MEHAVSNLRRSVAACLGLALLLTVLGVNMTAPAAASGPTVLGEMFCDDATTPEGEGATLFQTSPGQYGGKNAELHLESLRGRYPSTDSQAVEGRLVEGHFEGLRAGTWKSVLEIDGVIIRRDSSYYTVPECDDEDTDGDGVSDRWDLCPDTAPAEDADRWGCASSDDTRWLTDVSTFDGTTYCVGDQSSFHFQVGVDFVRGREAEVEIRRVVDGTVTHTFQVERTPAEYPRYMLAGLDSEKFALQTVVDGVVLGATRYKMRSCAGPTVEPTFRPRAVIRPETFCRDVRRGVGHGLYYNTKSSNGEILDGGSVVFKMYVNNKQFSQKKVGVGSSYIANYHGAKPGSVVTVKAMGKVMASVKTATRKTCLR